MNRALPMWAVLAITAILLPDTPLEAQTPGPELVRIPSGQAVMFGSMFIGDGAGPRPTVIMLHGQPAWSVIGRNGARENILELAQPLQRAGFNILASAGSAAVRAIDSNPVALDQPIPGLGGYTLRDMRRESLANQPRVEVAARLAPLKGRPLLIVQAKQDSAPTVSEAVAAYAEAARAVSALPFDHVQIDGDHNFTREDHRQELASVVVGWMTKHCT